MQKFLGYLKQHHLAFIALMIALGGTSYAAVQLPAHSVGNRQLKANSINSAKVRDHSLKARDFAKGQLPRGLAGIKGADGTNGANGNPGATGPTGPAGTSGSGGSLDSTTTVPAPPGDAPLRFRDDIFNTDQVVVTQNIHYGPNSDSTEIRTARQMDLYQPPDAATYQGGRIPMVVLIHGGSFVGGDKADESGEADDLAVAGYEVASLNYRMDPATTGCGATPSDACTGAVTAAAEDAQIAIRFLRANAGQYHVDPSRIAVGGTSAGAVTSLIVGLNVDIANPASGLHSADISGVISMAGGVPEDTYVPLVSNITAPSIFFHGTADGTVPYAWAVADQKAMLDDGVYSVLESFPGVGHAEFTPFYRNQVLPQTKYFLYKVLNLKFD